jgi:hypothetical protein
VARALADRARRDAGREGPDRDEALRGLQADRHAEPSVTRSDVENVLGYVEEESASVAFRAEAERASAPAGAASSAPSRVEAAPLGPLPDAALPGVKAMLTSYESVRERLAADDLAGAQKSAARVAEEATVAADEAGAAKQGLLELARAAKAMGDRGPRPRAGRLRGNSRSAS